MKAMRRILWISVCTVFCVGWISFAWAKETPLPPARNLAQHAAVATKHGMPLILLVSLTGCPYCEQVRRQHLTPLAKTGAVVKQIYLDSDAPLIDFVGARTTQRRFAKKVALQVAPTVFFFDVKGRQIAEPIVGALLEEFYGAYLDEAITTAKKRLADQTQ
jgi:thioredoxin-related protein